MFFNPLLRQLGILTLLAAAAVVTFFAAAMIGLPALAAAGGQCLGLTRGGGGEFLVNRCNICRMATVMRTRPGSAVPTSRQFSLRGRSDLRLPFKGPGRSRVTADLPCKGSAGEAPNLVSPRGTPTPQDQVPKTAQAAQTSAKCLSLKRAVNGGIALVNSCAICRVAGIHRQDASGERKQREAVRIKGGATSLLRRKGFAKVGLLGEVACKAS